MRGGVPVLAVAGVVDHQHPTRVRCGGRIGGQQLQPAGIDRLGVPMRLRQEKLQPLHRRRPGADHRFSTRQGGQRLVAFPGQQQPGQVLPKPPPLGQRGKQTIEADRVLLQRPRSRRTDTTRSHHTTP